MIDKSGVGSRRLYDSITPFRTSWNSKSRYSLRQNLSVHQAKHFNTAPLPSSDNLLDILCIFPSLKRVWAGSQNASNAGSHLNNRGCGRHSPAWWVWCAWAPDFRWNVADIHVRTIWTTHLNGKIVVKCRARTIRLMYWIWLSKM